MAILVFVSDVEHELVTENRALRNRVTVLIDLTSRALVTAIDAQDLALGHHDAWLDEALTDVLNDEKGQRV